MGTPTSSGHPLQRTKNMAPNCHKPARAAKHHKESVRKKEFKAQTTSSTFIWVKPRVPLSFHKPQRPPRQPQTLLRSSASHFTWAKTPISSTNQTRGRHFCFLTTDWPTIWRVSPTVQTANMNEQVVMKPVATTAASPVPPQAGSSANISLRHCHPQFSQFTTRSWVNSATKSLVTYPERWLRPLSAPSRLAGPT